MVFVLLPSSSGSGTYTTSSLSTKTTSASDPPNICKVKPQQLQMSSSNFSQLGCIPSLLPQQQQQQTPQVFVSQSAAGEASLLCSHPGLVSLSLFLSFFLFLYFSFFLFPYFSFYFCLFLSVLLPLGFICLYLLYWSLYFFFILSCSASLPPPEPPPPTPSFVLLAYRANFSEGHGLPSRMSAPRCSS